MSQQAGLAKDKNLREYQCWGELVRVNGNSISLAHLKRIIDQIKERIPRLRVAIKANNRLRKKEDYVRFLNDYWDEVKVVALAV